MLFVRGVLAAALLVIVLPLGINGKTRHSRRLKAAKKGKGLKKGNKAAKKSAKKIVESTATSESAPNLFPDTQAGQNLEEAASFDCEISFLDYYNVEIGSFTSLSADNDEQAKDAIIEVLLDIGSNVGFDCGFEEEDWAFSTTSALEEVALQECENCEFELEDGEELAQECVAVLTSSLYEMDDCDLKAGFVNAVAADRFVSSVLWYSTSAIAGAGFYYTTGDALKPEADELKPAITPVKNIITVDVITTSVQSENTAADLVAAISYAPVSTAIEGDSGIFVRACEENNYPSFVEFANQLDLIFSAEDNVGDILALSVGSIQGVQDNSFNEALVVFSEQQLVDVDVSAELNAKAKADLIRFILDSGPDREPCGSESESSCGEWNEEDVELLVTSLDDCVLKAGMEKVVAAALFFESLLEG